MKSWPMVRIRMPIRRFSSARSNVAKVPSSWALVCAAEPARRVATDAVRLHAAVGMTEEHDAQLFHRRTAVDALLVGRPTEFRRPAVPLLARAYA
ncbi:hypothetical protein [Streptomyces sp. UH6]|uniref:hypothetical protein n=1 Tax=Streptomyces sp. UH6 TaxID=2748379 RepID=UPI0015D521BF|nr:hypothetical protein [Streptomyces sp. UH6]NYV73382.1 hypothetical protein [Streptomyces sp. UH6]